MGALLAILLFPARDRKSMLLGVDWEILIFIFFLFLLVGTLMLGGFLTLFAGGLERLGGTNALLTASILLWTLGLLSSIVDNVPLAAVAAPLIATMSHARGYSVGSLVYATAVGTDVGGNGTPIGASANVAGLSVARRMGVTISWKRYLRQAFPIMVVSLLAANLVLALMMW
jgi:Na+/H+ antiporter NhaD/arsenite permease-like protein